MKTISNEDYSFAKKFGQFVNGHMRSPKGLAKAMTLEHRYLQSEMFKACLEYIRAMAICHRLGWTDGRNEWAAATADKLAKFSHLHDGEDGFYNPLHIDKMAVDEFEYEYEWGTAQAAYEKRYKLLNAAYARIGGKEPDKMTGDDKMIYDLYQLAKMG